MKKYVILIDENDNEIGFEEKIKTHIDGSLHRAFSVFVINSNNELLLQKRAPEKYHSANLWSNTCCSHPEPGENIEFAAHKRLVEEMGFDCEIRRMFGFQYTSQYSNGMTENEIVHVFLGKSNSTINPNKDEVSDYIWQDMRKLKTQMANSPQIFTTWFKIAFPKFMRELHC